MIADTPLVGISLAIAVPLIAIAMAIGPMANLAKKVIKWSVEWSLKILDLLLVLLVIPVGIGLVIAVAAICLGALIICLVIAIILRIFRLFWECTPWYRSREARKMKERSDVEVASRADRHDGQTDDDDKRNGEEEVDAGAHDRGTEAEKHYSSPESSG
jgi:hypothetical protein